VWSEADARRMTEEAGFADVSIFYDRASGDSRLAAIANRLVKMEEIRLVRGVKSPADIPADPLVSATPSLVGSSAG
jgi:hypothetical protein